MDKLKKVKTYDNGGIDFYSAFDCEHVIWMFLSILDFRTSGHGRPIVASGGIPEKSYKNVAQQW